MRSTDGFHFVPIRSTDYFWRPIGLTEPTTAVAFGKEDGLVSNGPRWRRNDSSSIEVSGVAGRRRERERWRGQQLVWIQQQKGSQHFLSLEQVEMVAPMRERCWSRIHSTVTDFRWNISGEDRQKRCSWRLASSSRLANSNIAKKTLDRTKGLLQPEKLRQKLASSKKEANQQQRELEQCQREEAERRQQEAKRNGRRMTTASRSGGKSPAWASASTRTTGSGDAIRTAQAAAEKAHLQQQHELEE